VGTAHWYYCLWSGEQVMVEYQTLVGTTFTPGTQPEQAAGTDAAADLRYQHWDLLSVRLVTNGSGNQVDTQSHDAYGGVMDSGGESLMFFTTYERAQTGLDYARARYYRSDHKRFTSPDPYGGSYRLDSPQSLNRYAYVANDPINRIDPTGRVCLWILTGVSALIEYDAEEGVLVHRGWVVMHELICVSPNRGGNPSGGGGTDEARKREAYDKCRKQVFGDADTFMGRAVPSFEAVQFIMAASAYGLSPNTDANGNLIPWSYADPAAIATIWAQETNFQIGQTVRRNPDGSSDWGPLQLNVELSAPRRWARPAPE